jgi:hypothetical protein
MLLRGSANVSTPSIRSTVSIRTTGAWLENSMAANGVELVIIEIEVAGTIASVPRKRLTKVGGYRTGRA